MSSSDRETSRRSVQAAVDRARAAITALLTGNSDLRPPVLRLALYDALLQTRRQGLLEGGAMHYFVDNKDVSEELRTAISKLEGIKQDDHEAGAYVSHADLYQLAGTVVIELICGRAPQFRFGRKDSPSLLPYQTLLYLAKVQQGGLTGNDGQIIKDTFNRIGLFDDKEIVALFPAVFFATNPTLFTSTLPPQVKLSSIYSKMLDENKEEKGANETTKTNFGHWKCLLYQPYRAHVESFATDHQVFLETFLKAYKKLSEVGLPEEISDVSEESHDVKHGILFAVAMTILVGFAGFYFEMMRPWAI